MSKYEIENSYEIIFDNGGGAMLQTPEYCHHYSDMKHLANDVKALLDGDDPEDWDGDEPENFVDDESYRRHAENGGLKCVTDWEDARDSGWRNESEFLCEMTRIMA
jgi:hypothetical protein